VAFGITGLCLAAAFVAVGCGSGSSKAASTALAHLGTTTTTAPAGSGSTSSAGAATTTTAPPTTSTTAPAAKPKLIQYGDTGTDVAALQQRLMSLGYWVGDPAGDFGDSTQQAVYAFQKAASLSRDGVVGPATAAALATGVRPQPRSTSGYVIEVDLTDDLMLFVNNGKVQWVLNTSTGGGYTYTDDGVTAVAETPQGTFHIFRQVDGMVTDSLGSLWRPKFFEGGFAIHGDGSVPPYPASHGCARVSNAAIDLVWANNLAPIGTTVWVY
jgi:peptidoglycan hydrolase-like protein with peptidoglycan-binding domain